MNDIEYASAYTEVLEIIKYIPEDDYKKIPLNYIDIFTNYSDKNYLFKYNPKKTLDEQNVSKKTKEIIALLYRNFWASGEKKDKILNYQRNKRIQIEKEKQERYNLNEIFNKPVTNNQNKENIQENNTETSLVEVKENLFTKFKYFFKNIFKRH